MFCCGSVSNRPVWFSNGMVEWGIVLIRVAEVLYGLAECRKGIVLRSKVLYCCGLVSCGKVTVGHGSVANRVVKVK